MGAQNNSCTQFGDKTVIAQQKVMGTYPRQADSSLATQQLFTVPFAHQMKQTNRAPLAASFRPPTVQMMQASSNQAHIAIRGNSPVTIRPGTKRATITTMNKSHLLDSIEGVDQQINFQSKGNRFNKFMNVLSKASVQNALAGNDIYFADRLSIKG